MKKPCQVSLDASQVRMELMQQVGVLELGLDAAESIGAENSFERMLANQAVTCHKTALQLFAQSEEYRATGENPEKWERLKQGRGETMRVINKKVDQLHGRRNGSLKNGNPPCDLSLLPRCDAKAKSTGVRCKQAAMKNGKCYWHGGASTGAPLGNMNSFKHGMYTKESLERQKNVRQLLKTCREALNSM